MALLAVLLLILLLIATTIDFASRNLTGRPAPGVFELSEIGLAVITMLALPYTMQIGGHVALDTVTQRMSDRVGAAVEAAGLIVTIPFLLWAARAANSVALHSYATREVRAGLYEFSLWPARIVVAWAFLWLSLEVAIRAWDAARAARGHGGLTVREPIG